LPQKKVEFLKIYKGLSKLDPATTYDDVEDYSKTAGLKIIYPSYFRFVRNNNKFQNVGMLHVFCLSTYPFEFFKTFDLWSPYKEENDGKLSDFYNLNFKYVTYYSVCLCKYDNLVK